MAVKRHNGCMKLKDYLRENGIKIYYLAKQIGIPRSTLKDIVNGKTNLRECRYSTLTKLASFLEIPVDVLVEEDGIVFYPYIEEGKRRQIAINNRQGHTGVCRNASRGDYRAYIKLKKKNMDLGRYKTLEEAIAAREAAEKVKNEYEKKCGEDV